LFGLLNKFERVKGMPYIKQEARKKLDEKILTLRPESAGDLNYTITRLCLGWLNRHGKNYLNICTVMGTFICGAFEFYRRVAAPYEDTKIKENGDAY